MKIHVIEITEYRPPEVLQVEEREIPTPAGPMGGLTCESTVYGLNGRRPTSAGPPPFNPRCTGTPSMTCCSCPS